MASKTLKKCQKELDISHDQKKKNTYDPSQQKIRVIQHNLVFVSGLPLDLANQQLLETDLYFGRYGKITKIIVNNGQNSKKAQACQVYITYNNQLEASTAIIALDGLTLESKPLKASYGTTKYCTHFLKNYQCLNSECFYLHHLQRQNQVPYKSDQRSSFIDKNDEALNVVCCSLQKLVQKIVEQGCDESEPEQGFPSLRQMIDFLIDSKLVNSILVDTLVKKYKSMLLAPRQDSTHESKKSKSNSFSTIASPYKQQKDQSYIVSQQSQAESETADKTAVKLEQILKIGSLQKKIKQQQQQNPQKTSKIEKRQHIQRQQKQKKQKKLVKIDTKVDTKVDVKIDVKIDTKIDVKIDTKIDTKVDTKVDTNIDSSKSDRKEEVQKIVQKLIIKQVLHKKNAQNKSRMSFVPQKKQICNDSQLQKMKSIIEKHLIASN